MSAQAAVIDHPGPTAEAGGHPRRRLWPLLVAALAAFVLLSGLGVWQLERRVWKHALIATVSARIHAPPVPAPGPATWPSFDAGAWSYRHVRATGHYLPVKPALVQAVTERGGGYWLLQPLRTDEGFTVLVNRGFVPAGPQAADAAADSTKAVTVTGLLRASEPGGAFLRSNDPAAGRWYSRDVAAIAGARGIGPVAPYFIDADAETSPARPGAPIGGLTVVRFPDNHLVYALTWFALALMLAGAAVWVARDEWRNRRGGGR